MERLDHFFRDIDLSANLRTKLGAVLMGGAGIAATLTGLAIMIVSAVAAGGGLVVAAIGLALIILANLFASLSIQH